MGMKKTTTYLGAVTLAAGLMLGMAGAASAAPAASQAKSVGGDLGLTLREGLVKSLRELGPTLKNALNP
ncbi:hypothetical protein D5S17_07155 [Pseudonocardiaceae bacterium YIM PH 21723]|nr:hypothetical protein D5S17_07155 [Pseudonocardiaceae bacterium YIM PH 21723]